MPQNGTDAPVKERVSAKTVLSGIASVIVLVLAILGLSTIVAGIANESYYKDRTATITVCQKGTSADYDQHGHIQSGLWVKAETGWFQVENVKNPDGSYTPTQQAFDGLQQGTTYQITYYGWNLASDHRHLVGAVRVTDNLQRPDACK